MIDLAGKMAHWFSFTADDRAACVLPTYYAAGSKLNIVVPLLLGQTITLPAGARPERLGEWISKLRPTWFSAGPTFLQAVLDDLRSSQEPPPKHDLRFITSGSAHLPSRVRSELEGMAAMTPASLMPYTSRIGHFSQANWSGYSRRLAADGRYRFC
jgi:acyl-CoA synthetase (AMP-forming)/AMP-acid ligase II